MKPPIELRQDKNVKHAAQLLARELWWPIREGDPEPICWIPMELFNEMDVRIGGLLFEAGLSRSSGYRALHQLRDLGYVSVVSRRTVSGRKARVFELRCQTSGEGFSDRRQDPSHIKVPQGARSGPSASPDRAKSANPKVPPAGKSFPSEPLEVPPEGKKVPEMGPENPNSLARSNQENQRNRKKGLQPDNPRAGARSGEPAGFPLSSSVLIRRREITSEQEISDLETDRVRAVLRAVTDARCDAGWRVPPEGYKVATHGAFVLERLREGVEPETLCAAAWAISRDAKTSIKPEVRAGRYVEPRTLYRKRNWTGWIGDRARAWLDEQSQEAAPVVEATNSDGSIALGLEIAL